MGKKKSKKPKKAGKLANDVYLYDHNGNARLDRMICREYLWKMVELTSHNYHRTYNYYNSNCSSSQISDQKNDNNVITVDFSDTSNEITTDKSNCYEVNDTNSYNYDGIDVDSVVEYETIDTSEAELLGLPVSFKSNKHIYFGDNGQNYDANDIDRDRNCPVGYLTTLSNSSRNSLLINNTIPKSDNSSIKKKKKKRKVSKTIHDFIFDNNKLIIENNICGIDPLWFIDNSEEASKLFTVLKPDGYYSVNTGKKGIDVSEDSSSNFILRILGNAPSYTANCQTVVAQVVDKEFTTTNRIAIDRKYLVPIDVNNLQLVADYVEAIKNCLLEDPHAVRPKGVPIKYWIQRYRLLSRYDDGVMLDDESWYSITPEILSDAIYDRCALFYKKISVVLDCFSGCGGNAISFAKRKVYTIAIDIDPEKLKCFRHNLGLYDAIEYCECVCSDAYKVLYSLVSPCDYESVLDAHCTMSLLKKDDVLSKILYINDEGVSIEELVDATDQDEGLECIPTDWDDSLSKIEESMTQRTNSIEGISLLPDLIILAPPWGGPDYIGKINFDLYTDLTCGDGIFLILLAAKVSSNIVCILPKNTIDQQLTNVSLAIGTNLIIDNIYLNNNQKVKVAYFGKF